MPMQYEHLCTTDELAKDGHPSDADLSQEDLVSIIHAILRDGFVLWITSPIIAAASVPWTTCRNGIPNVTLALFVITCGANLYSERNLVALVGERKWRIDVQSFPEASVQIPMRKILTFMENTIEAKMSSVKVLMGIGLLEMSDILTDYGFPVQANACDPQLTQRWENSWGALPGSIGTIGFAITDFLHFSGLSALILLVFVVLLQGVRGAWQTRALVNDARAGNRVDAPQLALAAEWAGHMVLSEIFERVSDKNLDNVQTILDNMNQLISDKTQELERQQAASDEAERRLHDRQRDKDKVQQQRDALYAEWDNLLEAAHLEACGQLPKSGNSVRAVRDQFEEAQGELDRMNDTVAEIEAERPRLFEARDRASAALADAERRIPPAIAEISEQRDRGERVKVELVKTMMVRVVTKVLGENSVRVCIQSSFFGLSFVALEEDAKIKVVLSMLLSGGSAANKTRTIVRRVWGVLGRRTDASLVVVMLIVGCFVATALVRCIAAFVCDSGVVNLMTGCVPTSILGTYTVE